MKLFLLPFALGALLIVLVLYALPFLALAFGVSLVVTGAWSWWGSPSPSVDAYFATAWKTYVALAIYSFAFYSTFEYQNCCAGLRTFASHLRHRTWREFGATLLMALSWPVSWYRFDRWWRGWGFSFADAIINAAEYWCVSRWQGVPLETFDPRTGHTEITRVKNAKEAAEQITKTLV